MHLKFQKFLGGIPSDPQGRTPAMSALPVYHPCTPRPPPLSKILDPRLGADGRVLQTDKSRISVEIITDCFESPFARAIFQLVPSSVSPARNSYRYQFHNVYAGNGRVMLFTHYVSRYHNYHHHSCTIITCRPRPIYYRIGLVIAIIHCTYHRH